MAWTRGGRPRTGEWSWKKARAAALARDDHQCVVLDEEGQRCPERATTVDHIVPHSKGGTDELPNLQSMCQWHHDRKSARERSEARWAKARGRPPERHPGLL